MNQEIMPITLVCVSKNTNKPKEFTYYGTENQVSELVQKCYKENQDYVVLCFKTPFNRVRNS